MQYLLEYYIITTPSLLDCKYKSITVNHNCKNILFTIKKVTHNALGIEELILPQSKSSTFYNNYLEMQSYLKDINKKFNDKIDNSKGLVYESNYFIVPLAVYTNKIIVGIIIFEEITIARKYIVGCWNLLTYLNCNTIILDVDREINTKKEEFDVLAGIMLSNKEHIPKELQRYFINAHNYLPKFQIIRREKKNITSFFQNRLNP